MPAALEFLQDLSVQGATANQWFDLKWNSKWQEMFIPTVLNPSEMTLTLDQLESSVTG